MKNRLLKTFTSLVLTVLMVISVMPAFAINIGAEEVGTYKLVTDASTLAVDDQVIIVATDSAVAMSTTQNKNNRGQVAVEKSTDKSEITSMGNDVQVFKLEAGTTTGTFAFNTGSGYIYAASSSNNYLKTETALSDNSSWTITITSTGVATIKAQGSNTRNLLQYNKNSSIFSSYGSAQQGVSIYKLVESTGGTTTEGGSGSETTTETPACKHTSTTPVDEVPATCTTTGYTAGTYCNDCENYISGHEVIDALGHKFVDGECTVCHAAQPTTLTINRDSFTADNKPYGWYDWAVTIDKDKTITGSGFIYGDAKASIQMNPTKGGCLIYNADPLPGKIVSIKLTAASGTPRDFYVLTSDTPFTTNTPNTTNATAKNVTTGGATWEFTTTDRYFAIVVTGGAAYLSSIEISYEICKHTNRVPIGVASEATCTKDGITAGSKCSDCDAIIEEQTVIPATGHKDENSDGNCDLCGNSLCTEHVWIEGDVKVEGDCTTDRVVSQVCEKCGEPGEDKVTTAPGHTEVTDPAVDATCSKTGLTEGKHCSVCGKTLVAQTDTSIIGHNYVDGTCSMCGKAEPVLPFKVGDVVIFTGSKADGTDTREFTGFESDNIYGTATQYTGTPAGSFPLTVVKGYENGTFAFKNGDNYITCYGDKNVKLSATLDKKSSWTVEIKEDGSYNIISCSNTNYYLQYNPASPRFTTYSNSQQPIKVVKYPTIKSFSLSLNEGVTVKVTFDIPEAWLTAKVVFNNGEKDIETIDVVAGVNVYSVKLTPAQINDDLTVKITDSEGNTILVDEKDVSVSAYQTKAVAAGASEQLIALLNAALTYSSVADGTYDGEDLENGFDGVADPTIVHADENNKLFTGFEGQLGTYASIYINVNTANVPDGETLILTVGTGENERVIINGDNIAKYITKDDQIVITGLFPANFDDTISIDTTIEGSMAEFTFNSYLKAIYKNSSDQSVKNLAVATYLYGLAAEAYLTAK